jgi:hypothetical protein
VFTEPLPSNGRLLWLHYSGHQTSWHNTIDKVQQLGKAKCDIPSSGPFRTHRTSFTCVFTSNLADNTYMRVVFAIPNVAVLWLVLCSCLGAPGSELGPNAVFQILAAVMIENSVTPWNPKYIFGRFGGTFTLKLCSLLSYCWLLVWLNISTLKIKAVNSSETPTNFCCASRLLDLPFGPEDGDSKFLRNVRKLLLCFLRAGCLIYSSTLKVKAAETSKTSVRRYIPEDDGHRSSS